jgi:membrane protein
MAGVDDQWDETQPLLRPRGRVHRRRPVVVDADPTTGDLRIADPTTPDFRTADLTADDPTTAELPTAGGRPAGADTFRARLRRTAIPRRLGRVFGKLSQDRVLGMSAEAGFWGLLSLPSLLLAVFGALGYLAPVLGHSELKHIHDDVLRAAGDVLSPQTVTDDVGPLVAEILNKGHAEVVSVSFVISLWSGSSATSCYLNTITVAYGMRGVRSAVRSRLVALGLYLLAVVAGVVVLPALILGPDVITDLAPKAARSDVSTFVHAVYWPALVLALAVVVVTLYRLCLPVRVAWRRHVPGALVAMAIAIGGSIAVREYIARRSTSTISYGALGAPIAALLFFYVTALGILLGAELNAALWPVRRARRATSLPRS